VKGIANNILPLKALPVSWQSLPEHAPLQHMLHYVRTTGHFVINRRVVETFKEKRG
jgi:hypothetical protein